jgi:hypothetical protein
MSCYACKRVNLPPSLGFGYGDPSKSGLALTVDQANMVFDIPLKGKAAEKGP